MADTPLVNPVLSRQRGRPAKNSPVIYDGVMVMTGEEHERSLELLKTIQATGEKVTSLMISTAQMYYELGSIIYIALMRMPGQRSVTTQQMNQVTGIPARRITTALKIYKHFMGKVELLENLTMRDVALLVSEKPQGEPGAKEKVEYGIPQNQLEFADVSESFAFAPVSGIKLERYRVRSDGGTFYLLCREMNSAIPACSLTVAQPKNELMQQAYNTLNAAVQSAIEAYYAAVEQTEQNGQLNS